MIEQPATKLAFRLSKLRIQPAENVKFTLNGCFILHNMDAVEIKHKHIIHENTKPAMFNDWYFFNKPGDVEMLVRVLSFFGADKTDLATILNNELSFELRATHIKTLVDKFTRERKGVPYYMKILAENGRGKYKKYLFISRGQELPIIADNTILKYSEEEKLLMQIKVV